jgi:hypothetical protein
MTCNGTTYCQEGDSAVVTILSNGNVETFNVTNAPICVEIENNSNNKKCWHFWGTSGGTVTFEHFACGESAYYQPDASLSNNGAWLVVDGVIQNGTGYFYWTGGSYARYLQQVTTEQPKGGSKSGSCSTCLNIESQWIVTIKDKDSRQLYQKTFTSNPSVKVSCNGCPPNHIKCECSSYPGYCCISCAEIKSGIAATTALLRSINNG